MPEPLRRDVRLLGSLLGRVVAGYGGQGLPDDVERLRHEVIAARRPEAGEPNRTGEIAALVAGWSLDRAELVARAFTVYFHLVNLAEEHQRIRTLRERDTGDAVPSGSMADAVRQIRAAGGRPEDLAAGLELHPVLTAHPTEARRRAVVSAIQRISLLLTELDDARRGASEQAETDRRLLEEIDLLWRTAQLRRTGIGPLDEVRTAMSVFDDTLFRVVPAIYRSLDEALAGGSGDRAPRVRPYLRFGSWIGGDRDGNPHV